MCVRASCIRLSHPFNSGYPQPHPTQKRGSFACLQVGSIGGEGQRVTCLFSERDNSGEPLQDASKMVSLGHLIFRSISSS